MTLEKNGLEIPDYLSKDFFQKALENGLKESNVQINDLSFTMGSNPGDNYSSFIYRVNITYNKSTISNNKISLIIKSMPTTGDRGLLKEMQMHKKEANIYLNILPKLEAISNGDKFGPKCFYAIEDPVDTIVFEDLKALGYDMADRQKGLNEQHCKTILKKLGKYHAASMILVQKDPSLMVNFNFGMFTKEMLKSELYKSIFPSNLEYLIDVAKDWSGYEHIAEKLKTIFTNFDERCLQIMELNPNGIQVLNHGDMWVNNFMFTYNNNNKQQVKDTLFYDYQFSCYNSPGIDLNYFLYTSADLDTLQNKRPELILEYYNSFKSTLIKGEYDKIPSLENILNEIKNKEFYGFMAAIGILPLIAMEKDDCNDNSFEAFGDKNASEKNRLIMFQSKRFVQTIKYVLKRLDDLHIFD